MHIKTYCPDEGAMGGVVGTNWGHFWTNWVRCVWSKLCLFTYFEI